MKTLNTDIAIHDAGLQFYLFLNIKNDINTLIKELLTIEKCKEYHENCKNDKEITWYNSKTKLYIRNEIEGYDHNVEFTYKEINALYKERKSKYDYLIDMVEDSLQSVKASYERDKNWIKPSGAEDRSDILVDHTEVDSF